MDPPSSLQIPGHLLSPAMDSSPAQWVFIIIDHHKKFVFCYALSVAWVASTSTKVPSSWAMMPGRNLEHSPYLSLISYVFLLDCNYWLWCCFHVSFELSLQLSDSMATLICLPSTIAIGSTASPDDTNSALGVVRFQFLDASKKFCHRAESHDCRMSFKVWFSCRVSRSGRDRITPPSFRRSQGDAHSRAKDPASLRSSERSSQDPFDILDPIAKRDSRQPMSAYKSGQSSL